MVKQDHRAINRAENASQQLADQTAGQTEHGREHAAVPGQPANPQTDLERAANIRQALVEAEGLSSGARNVNVAVDGAQVTLRGRVESAVEKTRVEETAKSAAGASRIVSELVVVP